MNVSTKLRKPICKQTRNLTKIKRNEEIASNHYKQKKNEKKKCIRSNEIDCFL